MDHIVVFGFILNLIIGMWAVIYIHHVHKSYPYPFLQPMAYYTLLYNLGVLCLLVLLYLRINLPEYVRLNRSPISMDIVYLVVSLTIVGMIYSMRSIDLGFQEKEISPRLKVGIALGIAILVLSYFTKSSLPQESVSFGWLSINPFIDLQ